MIDPKELRIGNWVYRQWTKMVKQQDGCRTDPFRIDKVNPQNARDYDPIPLTEDIVLKSGFGETMSKGCYGLMDENVFLLKQEVGWEYQICISSNTGEFIGLINVESLHHLQNLVFDLTGEELKITL